MTHSIAADRPLINEVMIITTHVAAWDTSYTISNELHIQMLFVVRFILKNYQYPKAAIRNPPLCPTASRISAEKKDPIITAT